MSQNLAGKWFRLEEAFFVNADRQLIASMRQDLETAQTAQQIMNVCGIEDQALAEGMAKLNVSVETLAAFRLAPLVAVAWADDRVEENELFSIKKAAKESGISIEEEAMQLLDSWISQRPPKELFEAWCEYTKVLCEHLTEVHRDVLRDEIVSQVNRVAQANGGVLGFGSVSPSEKELIRRVESAFAA